MTKSKNIGYILLRQIFFTVLRNISACILYFNIILATAIGGNLTCIYIIINIFT